MMKKVMLSTALGCIVWLSECFGSVSLPKAGLVSLPASRPQRMVQAVEDSTQTLLQSWKGGGANRLKNPLPKYSDEFTMVEQFNENLKTIDRARKYIAQAEGGSETRSSPLMDQPLYSNVLKLMIPNEKIEGDCVSLLLAQFPDPLDASDPDSALDWACYNVNPENVAYLTVYERIPTWPAAALRGFKNLKNISTFGPKTPGVTTRSASSQDITLTYQHLVDCIHLEEISLPLTVTHIGKGREVVLYLDENRFILGSRPVSPLKMPQNSCPVSLKRGL